MSDMTPKRDVCATTNSAANADATTESVDDYIARTHDPNPRVRRATLHDMCPCQVRKDFDVLWERILEMTRDEDGGVRDQALHNLGDGSPAHLEDKVFEAAQRLYNDPVLSVRKKARRIVTAYRTTGKWNVL